MIDRYLLRYFLAVADELPSLGCADDVAVGGEGTAGAVVDAAASRAAPWWWAAAAGTLMVLAWLLFAFFCGFNVLEATQPSLASRLAIQKLAMHSLQHAIA